MTQTKQSAIAFFITADQLTEGDIVNYNNDILLVASEPEYRIAGITFDAIYLEVRSPNTEALSIAPVLETCFNEGFPRNTVSALYAV